MLYSIYILDQSQTSMINLIAIQKDYLINIVASQIVCQIVYSKININDQNTSDVLYLAL